MKVCFCSWQATIGDCEKPGISDSLQTLVLLYKQELANWPLFTGRLSRELQEMNVFMFWMLIILTFIIQYFFIRIDAAPSVYDIFPRNRHFNPRLTSEESEEQVQEKRKRCFCENNLCVIDKLLKCRRSVILGRGFHKLKTLPWNKSSA